MSITGRKGRNGKAWDNQYINRIVDMVGQVYHWAIGQEIYTYDTADSRERLAYGRVELCVNLENPRHGLPKLPETPKEAIIPTIEQFRKLLDELPKPEFRAFAIIGAHTGLRKRNILGMKIDDINFDRGVIIVSSHKTGKTPIVLSMHPELAWLLRDIVNNRIPEQVYLVETTPGRAYRDFHGVWNRACDRAGVHGFRFESLRNMYTTWRVEEGVSLGLIQQALAHSTVATTAKHYNKAKLATEIIVKTQRNILSKPVPIGDQAGDQLVTKQG
jgi:integrase